MSPQQQELNARRADIDQRLQAVHEKQAALEQRAAEEGRNVKSMPEAQALRAENNQLVQERLQVDQQQRALWAQHRPASAGADGPGKAGEGEGRGRAQADARSDPSHDKRPDLGPPVRADAHTGPRLDEGKTQPDLGKTLPDIGTRPPADTKPGLGEGPATGQGGFGPRGDQPVPAVLPADQIGRNQPVPIPGGGDAGPRGPEQAAPPHETVPPTERDPHHNQPAETQRGLGRASPAEGGPDTLRSPQPGDHSGGPGEHAPGRGPDDGIPSTREAAPTERDPLHNQPADTQRGLGGSAPTERAPETLRSPQPGDQRGVPDRSGEDGPRRESDIDPGFSVEDGSRGTDPGFSRGEPGDGRAIDPGFERERGPGSAERDTEPNRDRGSGPADRSERGDGPDEPRDRLGPNGRDRPSLR